MAKPSLGKGLGSLINSRGASPLGSPKPQEEKGEQIETVALPKIVASPLQPRTEFKKEQLHDLIESIRERGIIQPLIVRRVGSHYELIAGERRFRAAIEIGLHEVPVIIRKASDQEVLELALIENLQREGLNPIEEATAYERLAVEFHLTQEEIARRVGKSRAVVANALRLLDLDPEVKSFLIQGRLSVGHAKVLMVLKITRSNGSFPIRFYVEAPPYGLLRNLSKPISEKTRMLEKQESATALWISRRYCFIYKINYNIDSQRASFFNMEKKKVRLLLNIMVQMIWIV
jgi:ParB/RepB/Spo0J family partition protein